MTEAEVRGLLSAWEAALGYELARLCDPGRRADPVPVPECAAGGPPPGGAESRRTISLPRRRGSSATAAAESQPRAHLRIMRTDRLCQGGVAALAVEWVIDVGGRDPAAERLAWQLALALDDFAPELAAGAVVATRFHGLLLRDGDPGARTATRRLLFSTLLVTD